MKIRELMTNDVKTCRPETNLATVAGLMWEHDCGVLPVVDDQQRVLGVITDRDICLALGTKNRLASDVAVSEVMSGPAHVCSPDDEIKQALKVMQQQAVRRLPVVDQEGQLQGMLSIRDLVSRIDESTAAKKKSSPLSSEEAINTLKAIGESGSSTAAGSEQKVSRVKTA
ncbi:MAG TPA: CBS domain-containing protein [Blastocatellia bacterium]|nr:CBS domain-containing protein [Blastocatellia bacterium]